MYNLILTDKRTGIYTTYLHVFDMFEYLIHNKNYRQIDMEEIENRTQPEVTNILIAKFGSLPTNIVLYYGWGILLHKFNIPGQIRINAIVDDIHQKRVRMPKTHSEHFGAKILGFRKCSRIFSMYAYTFSNFYARKEIGNSSIYFFPHSVRFIAPFNTNPLNKILVSGRLYRYRNEDIYPFRQLMYEKSQVDPTIDYLPVNVHFAIPRMIPCTFTARDILIV